MEIDMGFWFFSSENWLRWICGSFGVCCNSGGDAEVGAAAVQLFNFHENQPELQTGCTWQRDLNIKLTSKLEHSKRGSKSKAIPISYHMWVLETHATDTVKSVTHPMQCGKSLKFNFRLGR